MQQFRIGLPQEKEKTYRIVTAFVLLLNLFAFGYVYFNAGEGNFRPALLWGTIISLTSVIFFAIQQYTAYIASYRSGISFIILAILWIIVGKYLLAFFMFSFALFGFYAAQKPEVLFTKDKIIYPSFPKKIFLWTEVFNVILKDGMLTIDLKNNRLIQTVITKASAEGIDEKVFNAFCAACLGEELPA